ncbi:hypothetical protein E2562_008976 [Oryza meyeriana var. granulata]|uniref:Uncharacterized protein n=1 Tax=Oryza meyeriana var. granulata TaxID=110450 RepID=A0A6G1D1C2_9ORYZ|nr:hypothetical protein E2562_008976 [Oryza meyeriana var. granulata]
MKPPPRSSTPGPTSSWRSSSASPARAGVGFDTKPFAALSPQFHQQQQEFLLFPTAVLSPAARYTTIERSVCPLPPSAPSFVQYYAAPPTSSCWMSTTTPSQHPSALSTARVSSP